MREGAVSQAESEASIHNEEGKQGLHAWIKVGVVAAGSALVGGLAAAWFYRKTLNTLREAESVGTNPEFRIPDGETEFDI